MKEEYNAIAQAGVVLQLDCPDLAMGRHIQFGQASLGSSVARRRSTWRR